MATSDRIKEIRKELGYSQTEFGEKLGVTRSVIKNIELGSNKTGTPESLVKLISYTFDINEVWLKTGQGEKYIKTKDTLIDELTKQYNLGYYAEKILRAYLSAPQEEKIALDKIAERAINFCSIDTTTFIQDNTHPKDKQ